jgi:hypothetical protein
MAFLYCHEQQLVILISTVGNISLAERVGCAARAHLTTHRSSEAEGGPRGQQLQNVRLIVSLDKTKHGARFY